jgi:chaperonin GroES
MVGKITDIMICDMCQLNVDHPDEIVSNTNAMVASGSRRKDCQEKFGRPTSRCSHDRVPARRQQGIYFAWTCTRQSTHLTPPPPPIAEPRLCPSQMSPLGDRLLVKPQEAEKVRSDPALGRVSAFYFFLLDQIMVSDAQHSPRQPDKARVLPFPFFLYFQKVTAGGILLTGSAASNPMQDGLLGTVVAVGDDVDIGVKAGDRVLFSKYGSSDLEVDGGQVSFVAQKSILAKLE